MSGRYSQERGGYSGSGNSGSSSYGRSRNGSGRGRQSSSSSNNYEQSEGVIIALLENFGFVNCADRTEDIFFHYSEVSNMDPNDLKMGDVLQFELRSSSSSSSSSNDGKEKALRVKVMPEGTPVQWDTIMRQDRIRGTIQTVAPNPSRKGNRKKEEDVFANSGTIGVTDNPEPVYFWNQDMDRAPKLTATVTLGEKDVVEFELVRNRKTKALCARNITLIQSERERLAREREARLLESATQAEGVVIVPGQQAGTYIRSTKHDKPIFVVAKDKKEWTYGEAVSCLVVDEGKRFSARQIVSVEDPDEATAIVQSLQTTLHTDVTGTVVELPQFDARSNNSTVGVGTPAGELDLRGICGTPGKVQLAANGEQVLLYPEDAPGGSYATNEKNRSGNKTWLQVGDVIHCARVVKESSGGSNIRVQSPVSVQQLNGSIRFEGVVFTIKEHQDFGFLKLLDRNVDVYFRLSHVLPPAMLYESRQIELDVGCKVSFDLWAITASSSSSQQEQLRAGRVLVERAPQAPTDDITGMKYSATSNLYFHAREAHVCLATNVYGVVSTKHGNGGGMLTIRYKAQHDDDDDKDDEYVMEESIFGMAPKDRYPTIGRWLDDKWDEMNQARTTTTATATTAATTATMDCFVLPDPLPKTEAAIVVGMAETKGFEVDFVKEEVAEGATSNGAMDWGTGRLRLRLPLPRTEQAAEKAAEVTADDAMEKKTSKRKAKKTPKPIASLRFDVKAIAEIADNDMLQEGDIVMCDIYQFRPVGQFEAMNVRLVKRQRKEYVGIVCETVANRNFGFISVLDDSATITEKVFFSFDNVQDNTALQHGDEVKFRLQTSKDSGGRGGSGSMKKKRTAIDIRPLPKGTLPKVATTTLRDDTASMESSGACKGYVLIEPSHTTLANTPVHKSTLKPKGPTSATTNGDQPVVSRWSNIKLDDTVVERASATKGGTTMKENGAILLLEDPKGLFAPKTAMPAQAPEGKEEGDEPASKDEEKELPAASSKVEVKRLGYSKSAIAGSALTNGRVSGSTNNRYGNSKNANAPRRGDLVSFSKSAQGKVKDVRLVQTDAARMVQGTLIELDTDQGTGKVQLNDGDRTEFDVSLENDFVSCASSVLRKDEAVEGVLYEGMVYGLARTKDLYVGKTSMISMSSNQDAKERPRLNLTLKKEVGGKIMAQTSMAKGPDGTRGFVPDWTTRTTWYGSNSPPPALPPPVEEEEAVLAE